MDKNKNENCLEGMQCPKCGQAERVRILAIANFTMTDNGSEDHDGPEYGDDDSCVCPDCDFQQDVGTFRKAYEMAHNPPVDQGLVYDNTRLRELLAIAYSGFRHLYTDDGHLQDSRIPMIDYRNDSVAQIDHVIQIRGQNMLTGSARAADFVEPEDP